MGWVALLLAAVMEGALGGGCDGGSHGVNPPTDGGNAIDAGTVGMDGAALDANGGDGGTDGPPATDGGETGAPPGDTGALPVCVADIDLGSAVGVDVFVGVLNRDDDDDLQPSCATVTASDKVVRWRAPRAGTWSFDTLDSDFDTALHVHDGACVELACGDDVYYRDQSLLTLDLSAGQEVFIVVERRGRAGESLHLSIVLVEPETDCADGLDNDRDTYADCRDDDCKLAAPDRCIERDCDDGVDNDGDLGVDCRDVDCQVAQPVLCIERACDDGMDNDGDLWVDCVDPDCDQSPGCREDVCDDGVDNDLNGWIDCLDASCKETDVCVETVCDNGIDDDGDGRVDCADFSCQGRAPCTESSCVDGVDNDGNGAVDCEDSACGCSLNCIADPCPHQDLGSALGEGLVRGNTGAACNLRAPASGGQCGNLLSFGSGRGAEATFRWSAPYAGTFLFDTTGSDYDVVLYLLADSCAGPEIACADDSDGRLTAKLSVALDVGQPLIVVVDGTEYFTSGVGNFVLSITAL